MKFIKATAILAGLLMAGAFSSCSNLDESDSGTISLTLPGSSERAATSSATAKENFLDSLVYEVYLTKDTTKSFDTENYGVDTFFQAVAAFFESLGSIQKQTGKAGDTISFRDIDEGDYNVYLCYKSDDYKAFGCDTKTISVKNGRQSRVKFEFDYPDSVKFDGYTAISNLNELGKALLKLSTDGVEYPNEDTYTKFYLTADLDITSEPSINEPETGSYGFLIDLNGHTITTGNLSDTVCTLKNNTNAVFKNGKIESSCTFVKVVNGSTVKFDEIEGTVTDEKSYFIEQANGTAVVTGSSSISKAIVENGLFALLGGTVEEISHQAGSLALVDSYTVEGVTFNATGENRVESYNPEGSDWKLVYFGGDSKIENDVDASSTLQYFRLMQTSECKTDSFITLSELNQYSCSQVTAPTLLTVYPDAPFSLVAPDKDKFILKGSIGNEEYVKWKESETTATTESNITYKGYMVTYEYE